jgi:YidC/Oxa1 family membrane protein insertase
MVLILATLWFFQSKFYYHHILNKKHPAEVYQERQQQAASTDSLATRGDTSGSPSTTEATPPTTDRHEDSSGDKSASRTTKSKRGSTSAGGTKDTVATGVVTDTNDTVDTDTVWIETEKLRIAIDEIGARVIQVYTREYTYLGDNDSIADSLIALVPEHSTTGGCNLAIDNESYDDVYFSCTREQQHLQLQGDDTIRVRFTNEKKNIAKTFVFYGDAYRIDLAIASPRIAGHSVKAGWLCGIAMSEKGTGQLGAKRFFQRKLHVNSSERVEEIGVKKDEKKILDGRYKWVSVSEKYFMVSIIADRYRDGSIALEPFSIGEEEQKDWRNQNYAISYETYSEQDSIEFSYFIGPGKLSVLRAQDEELQKTLFGGVKWFFWAHLWFPYICEFILQLLIWLHVVVKDYGIVILLLTIISKGVTFPLTQSSMKSMGRMKDIQPEVQKIKNRYKSDPQKMNQEIMALYKKRGINPMNPGCLPMILQMPIWISLFVVLRKAIELRGEATFLIPWVHDLSKPEAIPGISPLPFSLPMYGSNVGLLPIIMAVLMFFQNKMTMKDPNQQAMVYVMPVMMLLIFNNLPAGLVLYITFSNALQIVQQKFINKKSEQPA